MFNGLPRAIVTVRFDLPQGDGTVGVTITQLAALVRRVAEENGESFKLQRCSFDGNDVLVFGQASEYPYENLLVVPHFSREVYFDSSQKYYTVQVVDHEWPDNEEGYAVGYSDEAVVNAVKNFAADLRTAYEHAIWERSPEFI